MNAYISPQTITTELRTMCVMTALSGGSNGAGPSGFAPEGYEDTSGPK